MWTTTTTTTSQSSRTLLLSFLVFSTVETLFFRYVDWRQVRHLQRAGEIPEPLRGKVTEEEFKKSKAYGIAKLQFGSIMGLVDLVQQIALWLTGYYPYLYDLAYTYNSHHRKLLGEPTQFKVALLFMLFQRPLSYLISIPADLYRDFVLEEKFGFNKKTLRLFFVDELKSFCIAAVLFPPVLLIIHAVVELGGELFWLYLWAALLVITLVMMWVFPTFIQPLFNKFEPLKDEELRGEIDSLAKSVKYPLTKIYQVDESIRSAHSNAYLYGFWKNKRMVLYDTLLEMPRPQIVAVVGHELGHWALSHTMRNMILHSLIMLFTLRVFAFVIHSDWLYRSFGFSSIKGPSHLQHPLIIGLVLFSNLWSPVSLLVSLATTWLTRLFEFQADAYAAKLGFAEPLKAGLLHLQKKNLSAMTVDPLFAAVNFSHPHIIERLAAIDRAKGAKKDD